MSEIVPVILCGGSGTRLWPLSREDCPKQFVDIDGKTLFGETVTRAANIPQSKPPVIVCNDAHRFYAANEIKAHGKRGRIILEPARRNTAPAIALAALAMQADSEDPLILALPSDHAVSDETMFLDAVDRATGLAEQGYIVTFGVVPTGPETGFGYIERGEALGDKEWRVARFVEKPNPQTAADMLMTGIFFWNSGILLARVSVLLHELKTFEPAVFDACSSAWTGRREDSGFIWPDRKTFLASPDKSIDYAIMERTRLAAVTALQSPWNDMGSWEAFYQSGPKDTQGNVRRGDVLTDNTTRDCYLESESRLLVSIGLHDTIVVETKDAVLVAERTQAQRVKEIVNRLQCAERPEFCISPFVQRPWGSYETLAKEANFQVKRIIVNPGEELSLQMHHHRDEYWIAVSGTAKIINGDKSKLISENEFAYIPLGTKHRLKNSGIIPFVMIEVQYGTYIGEDDIVRFDDIYGRV